ncbi:MAG TPA: ribosome assembly cofactor RimP [Bacteroidales bacterium]|nr:MAG: hypothetical protein A2W98_10670 [Bacteroidetes bacterium GWF2_33_38]OFY85454.1 MAG: hypothetical protein A2236_11565 [Bacteroidetes bacterium RIFOXYA2_FULL_33_7]HBF87850.1 ribosome assembly cofactor RimP [Bacteroidales bacterium]
MIEKAKILTLIDEFVKENNVFLVDATISAKNAIIVTIDSFEGVPISTCVALSRHIEANIDREIEDYELMVASAGIGQPFKVHKQYLKNIGKDVEIVLIDGVKNKGIITKVNDDSIEFEYAEKVKVEGKKKKETVVRNKIIEFNNIKSTINLITF